MTYKNFHIKFLKASNVIAILLFFCGINALWAEGSKDLYPNGVEGTRATLYSGTASNNAMPFPTKGTHFVYAKVGETISLASSAQSGTNRRIRLYGPDNAIITLTFSSGQGNISNRTAELAGPRLPGQAAGGSRYAAIYHKVTQEGIYKVEMDGTRTSPDDPTANRGSGVLANSNWTQQTDSNYIWAWDISVANATDNAWQKGRVYTTVLNMDDSSYYSTGGGIWPWSPPLINLFRDYSGFFGSFKVLTRDGYVYNVKNNGMNGISFAFMVNNRGFHEIGKPNIPSYKSILAPDVAGITNRYHDPRMYDNEATVTQKIFYNNPDASMPESSIGAVPGGQTWLRVVEKDLNVSTITIKGVEGIPNQLGNKGAYIKFFNESGGDYLIEITPKMGASFSKRTLTGSSVVGQNSILWDGKDGNGIPLANGLADIKVELKLRGGEVHFPYIDMEINRNGIILELLSEDLMSVRSDLVFWNDTDIPNVSSTSTYGTNSNPKNANHVVLPNGTSSNTNGHKWGVGSYRVSGTFGDETGMDTWTFIEGNATAADFVLDVKIADLEIISIIPNKTEVHQEDEVIYNIKVKNNGLSTVTDSPFSFVVPTGFDPQGFTFSGNGCGIENSALVYDAASRTYNSLLGLPNGCEAEYSITLKVNGSIDVGYHEFIATIMRPNDVTDPDATNTSITVPPTNPFYECTNNGQGGSCNNIKRSLIGFTYSSLCFEEVIGTPFSWDVNTGSGIYSKEVTQPDTNAGFAFDIYELDNSFNMEINGIQLATQEIEFQKSGSLTQNIRFADGTIWEAGSISSIWQLRGEVGKPIIRMFISPLGKITMLGSKVSSTNAAYVLEPLELFGGNSLNTIIWNSVGTNTVKITQKLTGPTVMNGYGYGKNVKDCRTYSLEKNGVFQDKNKDGIAQPGETIMYTLTLKNFGDIDIYNVVVNDPLLGGNLTTYIGDNNNNGILETYETWTFTAPYVITQQDIDNKGVYNLASVTGKNELDEVLDMETSVDPVPLSPSDPNYDSARPNHTFVPLKRRTRIITNPNIYQRIKNN